jgi:antitoxin YefM
MTTTTYTEAREHLAELLNRAVQDRETIIIKRRKGGDVALIAADELAGLLETVHLLRSSANAERLLQALDEARAGQGEVTTPAALRAAFDLAPE